MALGPNEARKLHDKEVKPILVKLEAAIDEKLSKIVASEFYIAIPPDDDFIKLMDHDLASLSMKYHSAGWPSFRIKQSIHGIEIDANTSTDQRDYMRSYQEDR